MTDAPDDDEDFEELPDNGQNTPFCPFCARKYGGCGAPKDFLKRCRLGWDRCLSTDDTASVTGGSGAIVRHANGNKT